MSLSSSDTNGLTTTQNTSVHWKELYLDIDGVPIQLSIMYRGGHLNPILFCHGFGGTKEDYADISIHQEFAGRPFIAYDTPGSGESTCYLSKLSIPFLVAIAQEVLKQFDISRYHLVGHSMGGLTALLLAQRDPAAVLSFVNIKGNLAPEDCFLSRQIFDFPSDDTEEFLNQFILRTRQASLYGNGLYAASFRSKVRPDAVRPTFESMVHISDQGNLLSVFESLQLPRMYMFGEQYASLSYLTRLEKAGVELAEIPRSGHFVMYSNSVEMWRRISQFHTRAECG